MTPEERERMLYLCQRIQEEKNPKKFTELVKELNELLEGKTARLAQQAGQPRKRA